MGCSESELGMCPSEDAMFKYWCDVADGNFSIFDQIFCVLPNDTVTAMPSQGIVIFLIFPTQLRSSQLVRKLSKWYFEPKLMRYDRITTIPFVR